MKNVIYPCLWYENQALEAAEFYCSIFKNSKITTNTPMVVEFELNGNKFMGLNGGPQYKFTEAISFVVNCDNQEEIDFLWEKLSTGGSEQPCGWVKDKYGMSWQIIPSALGNWMMDPTRAARVMKELMQMKKLDMKVLEEA